MTLSFARKSSMFAVSAALAAAAMVDPSLRGQSSPSRAYFRVAALPDLTVKPIPGDFDSDGRMDLVAGRRWEVEDNQLSGGELAIARGDGNGTFAPGQTVATPFTPAGPLAVGDFNADGHLDLIARDLRPSGVDPNAPRDIWILAGRGDGTFDSARTLASPPQRYRATAPNTATVADFNGDSHPDLAIALDSNTLHVYPGNGDLSFAPPLALTTSAWPEGITAADLNGDHRPDIAVAARDGHAVDLFINQGGLAFGTSSLPLDRAAQGVTAADLDADGRLDLIVAAAREDIDHYYTFHDGRVLVLRGNGDGTFQMPSAYTTPRGTSSVVAGDFNRDGLLDVATSNWTGGDVEECGPLWGSVSILPGDGAGGLGQAKSYQLSYDRDDWSFLNRIHSLHAARLDGDEHLDLVTASGALLNTPATPNRPPVASAGDDQVHTGGLMRLRATASDPDNDYLSYAWSGPTYVEPCLEPTVYFTPPPGPNSFTLTVSDEHGGTAFDSVTVTNYDPQTAPSIDVYRPQFHNPVPSGAPYLIQWNAFEPQGGRIVDLDILVRRGGESDHTPLSGCMNLTDAVSECVLSDPGLPTDNAELLFRVTDSEGESTNIILRFQVVDAPRGALPQGWTHGDVGGVAAAGAAGYDGRVFDIRGSGADIWGTADEFHWAYTTASGDFDVVARVALVQNVNRWTKAGLMIRETEAPGSRHASVFATPGAEKPVSFQRRPANGGQSVHTAGPSHAPPVWLRLSRAGEVVTASYRTTASGAWNTIGSQTLTDLPSMVLVGLPVSSHVDGTVAAASFDNVSITAAGFGSIDVQRPSIDEQVQINAPYTIRWMPPEAAGVARYDLFFAQDAAGPWSPIGDCANVPGDARSCVWERPSPLGPGWIRVVGSGPQGAVAAGRSERFQIVVSAQGDNGLPPGWTCGDVGAVGAAGSCEYQFEDELSPDFVVTGSGADIWGTADEFGYARYAAYGDFTFTARVLSVENVNRWTKAGLMIRDPTGGSGARHASFFVTPTTEKGTAFQRRTEDGGLSTHTAGPVATAPVWIKLIRTGNRIRAYHRSEFTDSWSLLGEQTFAELPYELSAMLAVSSHVDGALARAQFDNVAIDEHYPMQSADIGAASPGTTAVNGPEIAIEGNGADIWGTGDAFRFHYTPLRGNGLVVVRVRSLEPTHVWSKAGIMFRESLDPGSKHVMAIVSASRGVAVQYRATAGGASSSTTPQPVGVPVWLMLRRFGDEFTAYWSSDGERWHFFGSVSLPMERELFVGLPVTSHAPGTLASALFDDFSIRR